MHGRDYLDVARDLAGESTEAKWRTASSRAYYALLLECRDALRRWGIQILKRDIHAFVKQRFRLVKNADLTSIGTFLEALNELRARADYERGPLPEFKTSQRACSAVQEAADALVLLDSLGSDSARLTAAIAAIRQAFP